MTSVPRVLDFDVEMEVEEVANNDAMTDAEVLLLTRNVKLQVMNHLTAGGMPTEAKDVNSLMQVLDSIDRTAQTNLRTIGDQASGQSVLEAVAIIAAMQSQVGNVDPYMIDVNKQPLPEREVSIEATLVELDFVDGELSNEIIDLKYDSFVDNFEKNPPC